MVSHIHQEFRQTFGIIAVIITVHKEANLLGFHSRASTFKFKIEMRCSVELEQCTSKWDRKGAFSWQSDSCRTLIWRAPGTRYHHTIERHRYGGAGWLFWGVIIFDSKTDLHVQSVTMTGHIYRDVILQQHVRLFRGAMGAELLFMDDNARPHRANNVDECLQSEDITRMD
ncbi:transposable element Tcb1 transposase [Trichonephila clavipes]|nr:transposable element Tcb1 transposase [Trichonephila clavipes]